MRLVFFLHTWLLSHFVKLVLWMDFHCRSLSSYSLLKLELARSQFSLTLYHICCGRNLQRVWRNPSLLCHCWKTFFQPTTNETRLDDVLKSWLAFAAQKVVEVNALAKALAGREDEAFFSTNTAASASRKASPRVTNEAVQKATTLRDSDHRLATNVSARLHAQQKKLNLPILSTTTIGSSPRPWISAAEYFNASVTNKPQELDDAVLVHS